MIRRPAATSPRTQSAARSGVPIASSASSARLGAPPCSGPASAPIAAHTASTRSAPVDATTRAVNVDALNPWSIVRIMYCSTARGRAGRRPHPCRLVEVRRGVAERRVGSDHFESAPDPVERREDRRRHRRHLQCLAATRWAHRCRSRDRDRASVPRPTTPNEAATGGSPSCGPPCRRPRADVWARTGARRPPPRNRADSEPSGNRPSRTRNHTSSSVLLRARRVASCGP